MSEATAPVTAEPTQQGGEPGAVHQVCKPASVGECRIYFKDEDGQMQCPMSYRICQLDGRAWLPCGEYVLDENGVPVKAK